MNSTSSPHALSVNHLIKRYKKSDENAVDDISFEVQDGEFFSLLGPNGAGKTTTISILTTTLNKTSGTVSIAGYDLDSQERDVRRNIGIIFQKPSLDLNLTAEENLRFHVLLYGLYPYRPSYYMMPKEYKKQVLELADILGIKDDLFRPLNTYSGGMKRKLEIIRSLMHAPKVLFLDEPTAGLDPSSRKALWQYIKKINKEQGTTVFLTTHYLEEAEGADTTCILNKGQIVAQGNTQELKRTLIDEYLVVSSADENALMQELNALQYKYLETEEGFNVSLESHTAQEVIQSIKTSLSVLQTHIPTLEEAYLEVIDHNSEEGEQDA